MIKRYDILNHPLARILYEVKEDNNGEWVKWDDMQTLLSECGILTGKDADDIRKSVMKKSTKAALKQNELCLEILRKVRR